MDSTRQTNDKRFWGNKKDQKNSKHSVNAEVHKDCAGHGMATMESEKRKSNRRKRNQKRTTKAQMGRRNKLTNRPNIHPNSKNKRRPKENQSNKKIQRTMDRKQLCG